ncbi:methionyl-tRNA formyltransferase [Evansella cellulosilytica]|uniref:Methionyl-tRNA formyltransferase n=1 Tax=Evansella cellulosilytica (strain ATCC 21833 / DSM 2522 / FERM P-1141 / JCM 9156 / N-4) TaxID=649639 RepID=E6TTP1_EVAC2|nr:methionyl-tRNA formyltransferase [Evansella cellulosilytica]ADU30810.1 methionyl-tRNA formyltransferase [Evansella cellulosilytica DSM 2522]
MKVVFMGTPDFAVPILNQLVENGYDVQLVVTQPDRPKGRKQQLTAPPVKVAAEEHGIKVFQPKKIKMEEQWRKVEEVQPDIIITAAFGQILPKGLLEIPPLGCINVHASLLPKYRGGAPIHQSIIDGERETGITIMYMVEKLDAGDILSQKAIPIEENDTTGSMHDKLSKLGATLLLETLPEIQSGTIVAEEQAEDEVTYAPNISKEQEKIDWNKTAREIYNQVRGLAPWPVAYTTINGNRLKVWWTEETDETTKETPGTIINVEEGRILIACGNGSVLSMRELQPSGKKRMDVKTFLLGAGKDWSKGMKLGENDETR